MIGYIEGKILKKEEERILVLANQIGYEVLLPAIVMETMQDKQVGDDVSLYIFYQQTERQPKPVLIGFNLEVEKEFFQYFISVEDIGPLKAVKALTVPVREIATAIEAGELNQLTKLKGVGRRTAQKIIATLEGKMGKFALIRSEDRQIEPPVEDFSKQVLDVMIKQLGHRMADARQMIDKALKHNSAIKTAEDLFEEVLGSKKRIVLSFRFKDLAHPMELCRCRTRLFSKSFHIDFALKHTTRLCTININLNARAFGKLKEMGLLSLGCEDDLNLPEQTELISTERVDGRQRQKLDKKIASLPHLRFGLLLRSILDTQSCSWFDMLNDEVEGQDLIDLVAEGVTEGENDLVERVSVTFPQSV